MAPLLRASAAVAALLVAPTSALERPNRALFQGKDKCMKTLWPDVVDHCVANVGYHGSCQARIGKFQAKYGGSCDAYCSSFGFQCTYGLEVSADAPAAGCGDAASESYFQCSERRPSAEAVCTCTDSSDTFLWLGAKKLCGAGRALVDASGADGGGSAAAVGAGAVAAIPPPKGLVSASTCEEFCTMQGLTCTASEEPTAPGSCVAASVAASQRCDGRFDAERGGLCRCSGSFDRTGSYRWPDRLETCAAGSVLVAGAVLKEMGGTCERYCSGLRKRVAGFEHLHYSCYAACPAQKLGCAAFRESGALQAQAESSTNAISAVPVSDCHTDMAGMDAVCSCSFLDL